MRVSLQLRSICWLALLAMLALALLPSVSHAIAASRSKASWGEICTHQGVQMVAQGDAENPAPITDAIIGHMESCPFCGLSAGTLAMPPAPLTAAKLAITGMAPPKLFLHAPRTLFAWRSAQPRAPPSLS